MIHIVTHETMKNVRAKKHLGQHFLKDAGIAQQIVEQLTGFGGYKNVLEIGPGMGVLTQYLLKEKKFETWVVEIDSESVTYLQQHFSELEDRIIEENFLKIPVLDIINSGLDKPVDTYGIIGNLPYNISSQIFFNVLENRDSIPEMVCMIQKEVAQRIASPPKNKTYGILSVFLQAFYDIEYCFTVLPHSFNPPPKVDSGVIRLTRNTTRQLACDEKLFFNIVKVGFNQRRKKLKNPLRAISTTVEHPLLEKRAEELSVDDFVELTNAFWDAKSSNS